MAKIFQSDIVITTTGDFVALRYVESINVTRNDDDAVVEKLKGDVVIRLITLSGKEYMISMQEQRKTFPNTTFETSNTDLCISIYEKWMHLLSVK